MGMEGTALLLHSVDAEDSVCIDNSIRGLEGVWSFARICGEHQPEEKTRSIGKQGEAKLLPTPNRLVVLPRNVINMCCLPVAPALGTLQERQSIIFGFRRRLLTFAKISFTLIQQYIKLKSRIRNIFASPGLVVYIIAMTVPCRDTTATIIL